MKTYILKADSLKGSGTPSKVLKCQALLYKLHCICLTLAGRCGEVLTAADEDIRHPAVATSAPLFPVSRFSNLIVADTSAAIG